MARRRIIIVLTSLVFILVLVYLFIINKEYFLKDYKEHEIAVGKNNGSIIINAIDEYYKDQKQYPKALDLLVPNYLNKIPQTINHQPFQYSLSEVDIYIVAFPLKSKNEKYYCGYIKKIDEWECSGIGE